MILGGYEGPQYRVKHFYICFNGENFLKISPRNHWTKKSLNLLARLSNCNIDKSNFACVYMRTTSQYNSSEQCGPWASCLVICFFMPLPWNGRGHIVLPFVNDILSFHKLVSVHYLLNTFTHLIQIWYMDTS
jgi:hypothetical protein